MKFNRLYKKALLSLVLLTLGLLTASATFAQSFDLVGEWKGSYNINIDGDRTVTFTLVETDGVLSGTFDDPAAGMMAIAIESITRTGRDVRFTLPRIRGEYYGTIHSDLGTDGKPIRIDGDWSQAGEFIPITLTRKP